jgi:hypothetical protein
MASTMLPIRKGRMGTPAISSGKIPPELCDAAVELVPFTTEDVLFVEVGLGLRVVTGVLPPPWFREGLTFQATEDAFRWR